MASQRWWQMEQVNDCTTASWCTSTTSSDEHRGHVAGFSGSGEAPCPRCGWIGADVARASGLACGAASSFQNAHSAHSASVTQCLGAGGRVQMGRSSSQEIHLQLSGETLEATTLISGHPQKPLPESCRQAHASLWRVFPRSVREARVSGGGEAGWRPRAPSRTTERPEADRCRMRPRLAPRPWGWCRFA